MDDYQIGIKSCLILVDQYELVSATQKSVAVISQTSKQTQCSTTGEINKDM